MNNSQNPATHWGTPRGINEQFQKRIWSKEQDDAIRAEREQNIPYRKIAAQMGESLTTIAVHIRLLGLRDYVERAEADTEPESDGYEDDEFKRSGELALPAVHPLTMGPADAR